jgi:hypothetical protein
VGAVIVSSRLCECMRVYARSRHTQADSFYGDRPFPTLRVNCARVYARSRHTQAVSFYGDRPFPTSAGRLASIPARCFRCTVPCLAFRVAALEATERHPAYASSGASRRVVVVL